jgi:hypothetical protein
MQLVPILTKVVSSNPTHGDVYSIQHYVIEFVNYLRQVGGFLRVLLLHFLLFLDIDWFSFSRVSWLFIINKTGCFFHITSVCCFCFCCWIVEFNSNLCSLNSLISFCFSRVLLKWWRVEKKLISLIWNPDVMHMECPLYDNLQHWSG